MRTASGFLLATAMVLSVAAAPALAQEAAPPDAAPQEKPIVIAGAGHIAPLMEQYRNLVGDNLGNKPPQKEGRREINWDGVPDDKAAPAFLPADFFKGRGVILKTPGQGVQVSARAGNFPGVPPRFGNINPTYAQTFQHFSAERVFSPIGSNIVDVTFVVPGTDRAAVVRGFGAVYVDVDKDHTAFEFFDAGNKSLGRFTVPPNDGGFSFLGVLFEKPIVARVRIEYGTSPLGPDDSAENDVAVMDDFIYDEPQPMNAGAGKAPVKKQPPPKKPKKKKPSWG